jgi:hypothetical protein
MSTSPKYTRTVMQVLPSLIALRLPCTFFQPPDFKNLTLVSNFSDNIAICTFFEQKWTAPVSKTFSILFLRLLTLRITLRRSTRLFLSSAHTIFWITSTPSYSSTHFL